MEGQVLFFRDTWAEVDLDKIANNIKAINEVLPSGTEMIAVVKANAYGHGDMQVAETALQAGASYLAVAFLDEAIVLRKKGITAPILVLGASRPEDVKLAAEKKITLTVFQEDWIKKAQDFLDQNEKLKIHIKLDTGMGRIGIRSKEELKAIESLILNDERLLFEGVYTHFATADELDSSYFEKQLERFNQMIEWLEVRPRYVHSSNSAAALRFPAASFNAVRIGIAMYGLSPSPEIEPQLPVVLKEAFSLHSRLVHVKKLQKGDKVSYGATYEASGEEWIGTLPIGYADGWIRKLQGQEVLVEGIRAPIVGRICMDQCMIRLPYYVPPGTKCTLIGRQKEEFISVNEIAQKLETINYEIPCIISSRVPRIYKRNGETIDINNSLLNK
ncbi:alanine racemase [Bacillus methanolicus]|uniref:Alanine racemase n=1 Tax=Bacillus methanolicus (strain MGA3 / ATCC 53907) TaxID=796606 RepID=I3E3S3_BACMM|nr:alanine racemase [Bacillus methanolicus]AIE58748.1 Alanine racemase [Bacillus methanolicus MGA3]EIJ81144.1 alanine racemase [Bacillus methanolicus MGA3]UQD50848.1 alanine racemase [Bacillus methanolicus]